jgi:hypothetical protein
MRTEKPKKRLVSNCEYVMKLLDKGSSHAFAIMVVGGGCAILFGSLQVIGSAARLAAEVRMTPSIPAGINTTWMIAEFSLLSILCMGAIWYGVKMFKAAEKKESVALITRHNTGFLPEVETLMRSSDVPATDTQAELLRALEQKAETHTEQLLRATQESRQDV